MYTGVVDTLSKVVFRIHWYLTQQIYHYSEQSEAILRMQNFTKVYTWCGDVLSLTYSREMWE